MYFQGQLSTCRLHSHNKPCAVEKLYTKQRALAARKPTNGQSNLTKTPHRRRTWMVQSYSTGCANTQPHLTKFLYASFNLACTHPSSPHPKRHLDRFSRFCSLAGPTNHDRDRQTDRNHATPSITTGRICVPSIVMRTKNCQTRQSTVNLTGTNKKP